MKSKTEERKERDHLDLAGTKTKWKGKKIITKERKKKPVERD
jgi:hypothetical protein